MLSHDFARLLLDGPNLPIFGADSGEEIQPSDATAIQQVIDESHPSYVPFEDTDDGKTFANMPDVARNEQRRLAREARLKWYATQPKHDSIWIY